MIIEVLYRFTAFIAMSILTTAFTVIGRMFTLPMYLTRLSDTGTTAIVTENNAASNKLRTNIAIIPSLVAL